MKKGDIVRVFGRKTGLVESRIQNMSVMLTTKDLGLFRQGMGPRVMLEKMILIDRVVSWDDAGAPVLTQDNKLIGIVSWSTDNATVVMPILPILHELNVELTKDGS